MTKTKWDGISNVAIPESVAVCPDCGAQIVVEIYEITSGFGETEWRVNEDGSGVHIGCTREDDSHYQMPYVDWMPLDVPVIRWLNNNYDFDVTP
jgi:hypothetical protein